MLFVERKRSRQKLRLRSIIARYFRSSTLFSVEAELYLVLALFFYFQQCATITHAHGAAALATVATLLTPPIFEYVHLEFMHAVGNVKESSNFEGSS